MWATLVIVLPLAVTGVLIAAGALFALYGGWQVLSIGLITALPQWFAVRSFLDDGGRWTSRARRTFVVILYAATGTAISVGFYLAPVPLLVD